MSIYRSLLSLLFSHGLLLLANGAFNTLISLRTKAEAFPDSVIGMVLSGYFVGMLLSSLYAVRVVASIGHIRAFAVFASIASTVALAHLLWVNPIFWGSLRIISGFCVGGMIVVTEGWLNERANNNNRGTILSLYMITTYACLGGSQLLMMLSSPDGFKLFIFISILYSLALLPILLTQSQTPAPALRARPNIKRLYQTSPVGMTGAFVVGVVNGVFYTLAPIYALSIGLSIHQTAIFIALSVSSGMLLQLPLGRLSDRIDRRWVMAFSALMTAVACYILSRTGSDDVLPLYLGGMFYGCFAFSINPIAAAHVNDLAPANERTQTAGGLLMLYGIGAVIGPFMAGFIMKNGAAFIFLFSGSILFIFSFYVLLRLLVKPRHHQVKSRFNPFSIQSPARRLGFINPGKNKS